jgi:hypothetical protein
MILRYFIVMLLMLNLGAAAWWVFQPHRALLQEDVHAPTLQLVSEAVAKGQPVLQAVPVSTADEQAAAIVASDDGKDVPAEVPTPVSVAMPLDTQAPISTQQAPVALRCYRLGPFTDAAAQQRAHDRLSQHAAQLTAYDTPGKQTAAWRVFLPALPSREAAQQRANALKALGVVDLFVISQGDEANSIALGRFSNESGARRRLAELQGKGVQAQLQPVGTSVNQYWLDARLPQSVTRQTIAAIAPTQTLDCAKAR